MTRDELLDDGRSERITQSICNVAEKLGEKLAQWRDSLPDESSETYRIFKWGWDTAVAENQCWPRPIPVTERLPEINTDILVWCRVHNAWEMSCRCICDSLPSSKTGMDREFDGWVMEASCRLTHWLPLPPPPTAS